MEKNKKNKIEKADEFIIPILRANGCEIDENIKKLDQFSTELKITCTVHCIKEILGDDLTMSFSATLVQDMQKIGYEGTIEEQTFSDSNKSDIRKVLKFLVYKLPKNKKERGIKEFRDKERQRRNKETFISVWNAIIFCTVVLIVMDIVELILVWRSKSDIEGYIVTVKNVQLAFNKLGMQLTTSNGDEDGALIPLIVIESITIAFDVVQMIVFNLIFTNLKAKTIRNLFIAVCLKEIISMSLLSVFVDKMQPLESSELNKAQLLKSLQDGYKDDTFPSPGNADSDTWNEIFIDFQCCAVNAVRSTTNDFDLSHWCTTSGSCQQTNSQIPKACCKGVDKSSYASAPSDCHEFVNNGFYHEQGCLMVWSNAIDNLEEEKKNIYICGILVAVLHAISLILSICLLGAFRRIKEETAIEGRNNGTHEEVNIPSEGQS